MKAFLEIRSQHSKGTFPHTSPDTYVAVQIVPANQSRLSVLNQKVALKRGIDIWYFGEGYSNRRKTERSMLGSAIANGERFVEKFNKGGLSLFENPFNARTELENYELWQERWLFENAEQ